jgi:hypothetical protein
VSTILDNTKERINNMHKIVKVDLYIRWDDGLEEEISTRLPDGINSDLENFFDFLEEERNEDEGLTDEQD